MERELPVFGQESETKNKILDVAAEFFALKGFDAVSIRDIANAVGIKMSSIYYYYDGKEALLKAILARFEEGYRSYFEWLKGVNSKAETLEELMDNMFNKEFLEILNPMTCLGMSLIVKEQHNNEFARQTLFDLIYEFSIKSMKEDFDRLIQKGVIPPSDTRNVATLFMLCVLAGNDLSLHEHAELNAPIDRMEVYYLLRNFLTMLLKQGACIQTQEIKI